MVQSAARSCSSEFAALSCADVWRPAHRVIEFGGRDLSIGRWLRDGGVERYLAIIEPDAAADVARQAGPLAPRVLPWTRFETIGENNADVLILRGEARRALWSQAMWRRAVYVVVDCGGGSGLVDLAGLIRQRLAGRLSHAGVVRVCEEQGRRRTLLVNRVVEPKRNPLPRRYLSPLLGVRGMFEHLHARGVRYAVLRWFDELPHVEPGGDIDMLIADEDMAALGEVFDAEPGVTAVDVFSVSGLPGSHYHNVAYYPPPLAERLLDRAAMHCGGFLVPAPDDSFDSLAYHALYHKGEASGLATDTPLCAPAAAPGHDYAAALRRAAAEAGVSLPPHLTMEALDELLAARGWRPPRDTLLTLSRRNRWISNRFFPTCTVSPPDERGLAVFVIRQRAIELGLVDEIVRLLEARGFHMIDRISLDRGQREACAMNMRGGNWSAGLDPVSGGGPAVLVVAGDPMPARLPTRLREEYPHCDNARVISAKRRIREAINRTLPADAQCNLLHAADNDEQAWSYVRIAAPHRAETIREHLRHLHAQFRPADDAQGELPTYGIRARLEIVDRNGQPAVRKTFRPGCERFASRERFVMAEFSRDCAAIPPLLDADDRSVTMPLYCDALEKTKQRGGLLPLAVIHQMLDALDVIRSRGYTLIDFHPLNVLVDRTHGLKIVDFEFCQRLDVPPATLETCYELAGLPDDFPGDKPELVDYLHDPYEICWRPYTGLSRASLLHDPTWMQHIKRSAERGRRVRAAVRHRIVSALTWLGRPINYLMNEIGERRLSTERTRLAESPPAVRHVSRETPAAPQHEQKHPSHAA